MLSHCCVSRVDKISESALIPGNCSCSGCLDWSKCSVICISSWLVHGWITLVVDTLCPPLCHCYYFWFCPLHNDPLMTFGFYYLYVFIIILCSASCGVFVFFVITLEAVQFWFSEHQKCHAIAWRVWLHVLVSVYVHVHGMAVIKLLVMYCSSKFDVKPAIFEWSCRQYNVVLPVGAVANLCRAVANSRDLPA